VLLVLQQNNLLSDPPVLVPVPDVVGQSQASGTAELEGDLFVVAVATAYSSTVAAGDIISQDPAAAVEAPEGSTVTITVSLGEAPESSLGGVHKKRKRRKLFVEIDGQQFTVRSETEAAQLLQQARALAERSAEKAATTAESNVRRIARRTGSVPALKVKAPDIRVSPELKAESRAVIAEIDRLYKQAATIAELRILMEERLKKEAADEMEAELLLLL
jgi:hypothetical protein